MRFAPVFLGLALVTAGCQNNPTTPITIFVAAPLSGPQENFGKQVSAGVAAAIAVHEREVEQADISFSFQDDGCRKDTAEDIAKKLVEQHAQMVLGHVCSISSIPTSNTYAANKIVMLSAASSNSTLTERGLPYVFRVSGRDDLQAVASARFMKEKFDRAPFAVVFENDVTGQGHSNQFMKKLAEMGRKPVAVFPLDGVADIPHIVDDPAFRSAAVIFYGGHQPEELGALLAAARAKGITAQFLSNDGANNKAVWNASGGAAEGLLFTFDPDYSTAPTAKAAVAQLDAAKAPTAGFTLPAYAAAEILIQTAERLRVDPKADLDRYLHSTTFETALGPVSFDGKGDFTQFHSVLYRWSHGEAHVIPQ